MSKNKNSIFSDHLNFGTIPYTSSKISSEQKRLVAVKCALELIASAASAGSASASLTSCLFKDMDRLSIYADQIQAALEVKVDE